jgi:hypothetical protein
MYANCPLLPALCGQALRFSPQSNSPLSVTTRSAMHNHYTNLSNFPHVIIIIIIIIIITLFYATSRSCTTFRDALIAVECVITNFVCNHTYCSLLMTNATTLTLNAVTFFGGLSKPPKELW